MSSEIHLDTGLVSDALSVVGGDERLRNLMFDALREEEVRSQNPMHFRETVRWPLILSMLRDGRVHRVELANGLLFDVSPDSRIEKALLLSTDAKPDHVWEPQTTKLLVTLGSKASNVIVGGAYIGDQVVPIARAMINGTIHAFEPMKHAFDRLLHHVKINGLSNIVSHRSALWDTSNVALRLDGQYALASSITIDDNRTISGDTTKSVSIDDYVQACELPTVELIMLDTEGGEEKALLGARKTITRDSPNIVFEVHRNFVDWSDGLERTSIMTFIRSCGYQVFAIRDFHGNYPTAAYPVEIIPLSDIYLDGPPHGFNVLAIRDSSLLDRLGLKIVKNVSPKLLLDKDPALHFPLCRVPEPILEG